MNREKFRQSEEYINYALQIPNNECFFFFYSVLNNNDNAAISLISIGKEFHKLWELGLNLNISRGLELEVEGIRKHSTRLPEIVGPCGFFSQNGSFY